MQSLFQARSTRLLLAGAAAFVAQIGGCACDGTDTFSARATLVPAFLDLGPIAEGAECAIEMGIENSGQSDLSVSSIELENATGDFKVDFRPSRVGIGTTTPIEMTYTAGGTLNERQTVSVVVETSDPRNEGRLVGTISALPTNARSAVARHSCTPDGALQDPCEGLDFGAVQISDASTPVDQRPGRNFEVVVRNDGNAEMEVVTAVINGGSSEFTVKGVRRGSSVETLPAVVSAGRDGECGTPVEGDGNELIIDVFYAPTDLGADADTLVIVTNAVEGANLEIPLVGFGSDSGLFIAPDPISFAGLAEGETRTETVTVANVGTREARVDTSCIDLGGDGTCDGDCTGGDPVLGGALSCDVIDNGKGFILAATDAAAGGADEAKVEVTWTPTAETGTIPAGTTLRFETNLGASQAFEALILGGAQGSLSMSTDTPCPDDSGLCVPTMGDPDGTDWSGSATFTLTNTGDGSLTITSFVWDGADTIADDYVLEQGGAAVDLASPGITIAPGANESFTIVYENSEFDASVADLINLQINHTGTGGTDVLPVRPAAPMP